MSERNSARNRGAAHRAKEKLQQDGKGRGLKLLTEGSNLLLFLAVALISSVPFALRGCSFQ